MDRELKTFKFEVKEIDEAEGTFKGHASTFAEEPDSYNDIVDKGAFLKTIKEGKRRIKHLWNHSVMEPIGKPTELSEDETGLSFTGKLSLGVQRAREVLSLIKDGVITEMSIGYDVIKEYHKDGIRHLTEVRLWDISPVTFAANPEALITSVKEREDSKAGRVLSAVNLEKVKKAFDALQALLEAAEKEPEPGKSTLLSDADKEAAKLETLFTTLKAENDGFDTKEAEKRIESILEQLRIKTS